MFSPKHHKYIFYRWCTLTYILLVFKSITAHIVQTWCRNLKNLFLIMYEKHFSELRVRQDNVFKLYILLFHQLLLCMKAGRVRRLGLRDTLDVYILLIWCIFKIILHAFSFSTVSHILKHWILEETVAVFTFSHTLICCNLRFYIQNIIYLIWLVHLELIK